MVNYPSFPPILSSPVRYCIEGKYSSSAIVGPRTLHYLHDAGVVNSKREDSPGLETLYTTADIWTLYLYTGRSFGNFTEYT